MQRPARTRPPTARRVRCVRQMTPLRWLAASINVGLPVHRPLNSPPIAAIAATPLPINPWRAEEVNGLLRVVRRAAASADLSGLWRRPHLKTRRLKPGRILPSGGDAADRPFILNGHMEPSDTGKPLEVGRIFGEIAKYPPSELRSHTVRCSRHRHRARNPSKHRDADLPAPVHWTICHRPSHRGAQAPQVARRLARTATMAPQSTSPRP